MPIDLDTIKELARQGAGWLLAVIMFAVYVMDRRTTEKRLTDVLRERKSDRDTLLNLMGKIEVHLAKADSFERFAERVMEEGNKPSPKRRVLDKELADALAKIQKLEDSKSTD